MNTTYTIRILTSLFISALSLSTLVAQDYADLFYGGQKADPRMPFKLQTQVQNLDDFIARFNGRHNAFGQKISPQQSLFLQIKNNPAHWRIWRQKIIGSMMTEELVRQDSAQQWKLLNRLSAADPIHLIETSWSAYLPIRLKIGKEWTQAKLQLRFIQLDNGGYEWVLEDVSLDVGLEELPSVTPSLNKNYFIPPNAHGNGFLVLKQHLGDFPSIAPYIHECKKSFDQLEYLMSRHEAITIEPVFFVFQLSDTLKIYVNQDFYIFKVENE